MDQNVGKLTGWLRMMGYDTIFFNGDDDSQMVAQALAEGRVLLTRDTGILKRRMVTSGRLRAILINSEQPEQQMRQLMAALHLERQYHPFTLCLECNRPLVEKSREEVQKRVPAYVYKTQSQYMECPNCHRLYWRGTHWQSMIHKLEKLMESHADVNNKGGAL